MTMEFEQLAGVIDIDAEHAPDPEKDRLYRLWEEGNWSATALDPSQDIIDWREKFTEQQRKVVLWNSSMFLDGEESVTVTLAPFMNAVTTYEDRIFLATQIADEARHHVFFDRYLRDVCGIGTNTANTLDLVRPDLTWGYKKVFDELDRVSDQLRLAPRSKPLLAQGVALYHLVIEGMLAHTGQHYLRDYVERNNVFPSYRKGIGLLTRDESRHIAFGIRLLRELVTSDPACKRAAIRLLNRVLPWAAGVFTPPNIDWSYITVMGYTVQEVFAFAIRSIETKLSRAGIQPCEVLELVKIGYADSPTAQADRIIAFIEGGILGTDKAPQVSEKTMDAIFASTRDIAAWTQPRFRNLRATIQWIFDDAKPRCLELGTGRGSYVASGYASRPDLTLRCTAQDWGYIARGDLSTQRAVLTHRLRVSGNLPLALKLPQILPVND
jgi:hypothetical protein